MPTEAPKMVMNPNGIAASNGNKAPPVMMYMPKTQNRTNTTPPTFSNPFNSIIGQEAKRLVPLLREPG
jgi:hypothetical protein